MTEEPKKEKPDDSGIIALVVYLFVRMFGAGKGGDK